MTTSVLEVERKYDVDTATALPSLAELTGVAATPEPVVHELVATYYDTADLRLRAAAITLRHRSGGSDAGWHLKIKLGSDREELRVDGDDTCVPAELQALVRSVLRSAPLAPVARLSTRRSVHALLDAAGTQLVEVVDDQVEGQLLGLPGAPALRWREWEAELGAAPRALLDEVEQVLLAAGASISDSASKVGRVLASRPAEPGVPPWWANPSRRHSTAGEVVQTHLREQVDELVLRDPLVRRDQPDAVHKMRVASRRLRSALHTFRPLLDRSQTDPARDELRWLAGVLGAVRDTEVMHARLRQLIAAEPGELVLGPVLDRVDRVMGGRYAHAHATAVRELDGARYLALLDALHELAENPPFSERAGGTVQDVLAPLVGRTWTRLDSAMKQAEHSPAGPAQGELLHDARKLAKASRYAAEAVAPAFGRRATRFAAAMADLQEVLGEFQDGVVTREVLRELGAASSRSGENGFTFGRLHGLEQARAEQAVAGWPAVRARVSRPRLRRWLDG
ncbi:MAG: CYTH and CHAD domain-containing protein [Frankiales bacterium]|nr:CYTH and CHAD domain-containing protein [Frankiales bacterium]